MRQFLVLTFLTHRKKKRKKNNVVVDNFKTAHDTSKLPYFPNNVDLLSYVTSNSRVGEGGREGRWGCGDRSHQ